MKEFQNRHTYPIIITGPNEELLKIGPHEKIVLAEFYTKYVPELMTVTNEKPSKITTTPKIVNKPEPIEKERTFKQHILNKDKTIFRHLEMTKEYEKIIKEATFKLTDQLPQQHDYIDGITYVIPYRGLDRDTLTSTIKSIKAQEYPLIEIIVTEQDAVSRFNDKTVQHIFTESNRPFNKSQAFNIAVKHAKFNKIILHDADIIVPVNYTKKMSELLDKHDGVHIGKTVYYLSKGSTIALNKTEKLDENLIIDRIAPYFEGGSIGCKYNSYYEIGGFNDEFDGYGNEDTEFYSRLSRFRSFYGERSIPFIHLWHGRTEGWDKLYEKNQELEKELNVISTTKRMSIYHERLVKNYGYERR